MADIEKLDLKSKNVVEEQKAKLKELFPEVLTEGKIDFEKLRLTLGDEVDDGEERFGMTWPGKRDCFKVIQEPSIGTLKPCREESVDFETTENLFIEGDNLEVLKLLQKSYYGKVEVVCIDPPYNTGNEFIYPDKFSESLETYLAYTKQVDDEGRKFSTNTEADGRFHSKWLNMMYPRLFLARNLLKDDGIIFISIDDNEVKNLRALCDEIFGEENFIDCIIWKKRYGGGAKEKHLVSLHEYVLIYAKDVFELPDIYIPLSQKSINRYYKLKDKNFDIRGPYRTHPLEATKSMGERKNLVYSIPAPDGTEIMPKRQWLWNKERTFNTLNNGELDFLKDNNGKWTVHTKQYLKDENGVIRKDKAFSIIDNVYTQHGTNEIINLFGNAQIFPFPKPTSFMNFLINIGIQNKAGIILDFFTGSCSTAHAVLDLNKEDNGNRKFIMVQLPEPCDEKSEAYKAGYKTIADIGKERIRRVIKKIKKEKEETLDFGESKQDLGFKFFKLDKSNFKIWDGNVEEKPIQEQLAFAIDHIDPNSKEDDILYEILIKSGFELTTPVETLSLEGKKVYSVAEGALLICLEMNLTTELIRAIAKMEPQRVVCLDSGFEGNDQLKTNAVQIMKSFDVESFRTV